MKNHVRTTRKLDHVNLELPASSTILSLPTLEPCFLYQGPQYMDITGSCASAIALSLAGGWPLSWNSSMSCSKMRGFPAYTPLILPPTKAIMPMHQGGAHTWLAFIPWNAEINEIVHMVLIKLLVDLVYL